MLNPRWMVWVFMVVAWLLGSVTLTACFGSSEADAPNEAAQDVSAEVAAPTAVGVTPTAPPTVGAASADAALPTRRVATHAPPPPEDETALTIWANAELASVLREVASSFEVEYGLKITVVEKELAQMGDELAAASANEDAPDILMGSYANVAQWVANDLLHEVTLDNRAAEMDPIALQAFRVNDELYGLPYTAETVALIYNPRLIADAPTTWSDLQEVSAALQARGAAEYGLVLQSGEPTQFHPILTAFGGFLLGRDTDGNWDLENVGLDRSGALAAAAWLDAMNRQGLLLAAADADAMYNAFERGAAAMMIGDAEMVGRLRMADVAYAVAALPDEAEESQPLLAARGFMISADSRDPELAQTFLIEFMATPATMQAIFAADSRPSAYLPVLDTMQDSELAAFIPVVESIQTVPAIPDLPRVFAIWADALEHTIGQGEPAAAAFSRAAEQIRAAITTQ